MSVVYLPFPQSPRKSRVSKEDLYFYRITNGQKVRLINHAFKIPEHVLPQVTLQQQGEVKV
jgi:hypothetical protein